MLTARHRTNRRSAAFRLASNNFGDKYLIIDDDIVGPVVAGVEDAPPAADGALAWAVIAKPTNTKLQNYKNNERRGTNAGKQWNTHNIHWVSWIYFVFEAHCILHFKSNRTEKISKTSFTNYEFRSALAVHIGVLALGRT